MNNIIHGGDLDEIERKYKIPKNEILDFSGNINPLGLPHSVKTAIINNINVVKTYPDKDYINLKNSILNYVKFKTDIQNVLVGNGTTELISSFIKLVKPKNAMVISPAYSEYEREIKNNNSNFIPFILNESNDFKLDINLLLTSIEEKNINLLVICNPNNPTGSAISNADLEKILKFCKDKTYVMVDETYVEFCLEKGFFSAPLINEYDNLFVIRGTSKFFSVPGVRLGYAFCSNPSILNKFNKKKDPWSVNSFANLIGNTIFNDIEFINKTINLISSEKSKIYKSLDNIKNLKYYKSHSNFILLKILIDSINSSDLFDILIKDKLLIRDASNFEGLNNKFFRFCILTPEKNNILISKLKNIFS